MANIVKRVDPLLIRLQDFSKEKFLIYNKNQEIIGNLEIYSEQRENHNIIWFNFNFESYSVFKTSLKTKFSIPLLIIDEEKTGISKIEEFHRIAIKRSQFELGALIIGANKFAEKRIVLDKAKFSLNIFG